MVSHFVVLLTWLSRCVFTNTFNCFHAIQRCLATLSGVFTVFHGQGRCCCTYTFNYFHAIQRFYHFSWVKCDQHLPLIKSFEYHIPKCASRRDDCLHPFSLELMPFRFCIPLLFIFQLLFGIQFKHV